MWPPKLLQCFLPGSHHCVVFLGKIFYSNRMSSALERECVHQTVWDSLQNAKEEQTKMYKYFIRGDLNTL